MAARRTRAPRPDWPASLAALVPPPEDPDALTIYEVDSGITFRFNTFEVREPRTYATLARELAVPAGSLLCGIVICTDADARSDYLFELIGIPFPPADAPGGILDWAPANGGPRVQLQVWRERVYVRRSPVFGEIRWHPDDGGSAWIGDALEAEEDEL